MNLAIGINSEGKIEAKDSSRLPRQGNKIKKLLMATQISPEVLIDLEGDPLERINNDYLTPSNKFDNDHLHDILMRSLNQLDRPLNYDKLLHVDHLPRSSTLELDHDIMTGEVLGVKCVEEVGTLLNAANSTSLTRKPASYDKYAKGSTSNIPFEFGGLFDELRQVENETGNKIDSSFIQILTSDMKLVPPGFTRGLRDETAKPLALNELNIDINELEAQLEEESIKENIKNKPENNQGEKIEIEAKNQVETRDDVDDLLELDEKLKIMSKYVKKESKLTKRTFAHVIDPTVVISKEEFQKFVPEMARVYPFELDTFQKYAVIYLERGESVFVAAHTSAGKTVVAEYAIALSQKHMTRTIYTSPIKALSNQKFRDFRNTFGENEIGLLTGDVQIRSDAPCVIMTTEILRSMLYRGADMIRDVEFVVFDEVHYINDIERGVVWEEVIIMLPAHVNIILLSATVPNTFEFADWVGRTKKKNIYVISTQQRPVPLAHHIFVSSVVPHRLFKVVDHSKRFLQEEYKKAYDLTHYKQGDAASKKKGTKQVSSQAVTSSKQDRNLWNNLVALLTKQNLLPVVVFSFSKKRCEEYADTLTNVDLLDAKDKSEVHVFIERSLGRLKGSDKELPQIKRMRSLLLRGIGIHHGGLLPIVKELVEILFGRGLTKVLFATETFAMGVNMPAKSVCFSGTRKHDGREFRDLTPGEYIQMSGRAGRRGLDDVGVVILAASGENDFPDAAGIQTMILGTPKRLESQFRLTYNMILNLLRVEAIKVEDMMKRSFFEVEMQRGATDHEQQISEAESKLKSLPCINCQICEIDLTEFYWCNEEWLEITDKIIKKLAFSPVMSKAVVAGRIVLVNYGVYENVLGVILTSNGNSPSEKSFKVLLIVDSRSESNGLVRMKCPVNKINLPSRSFAVLHVQEKLTSDNIIRISKEKINVTDDSNIMFQSLYSFGLKCEGALFEEYDFESKIKDFDFSQNYLERKAIENRFNKFKCTTCSNLKEHYSSVAEYFQLQDKVQKLKYDASDKNLMLLPDYNQRLNVLKLLNYVGDSGTVQLKGKVACEINSSDSILLTELIMENIFTSLDPDEIASLLSAFVFQEKSDISFDLIEPKLPQTLRNAIYSCWTNAERIAQLQRDTGLDVSVEDYININLNFGLCEVVLEWAKGMSFKQVTTLTDVLEGSIVRTITRLDELCRELRDAARVIGNAVLYQKMDEASSKIKRDIVFAASLYV